MQVFIEAERNSTIRTRHNEQTLELLQTFSVSKPYPFAYGFILGTATSARDALDCFVITRRPVKIGATIQCEPLDAFIQHEDEEEDLKVIAVDAENPPEVDLSKTVDQIQTFIVEIFKNAPEISISFSPLFGKEKTMQVIQAAQSAAKTRSSAPCAICTNLENEEYAFQKYGWPEDDTFLPAAAARLLTVRNLSPHGSRVLLLKRCPECGTYYLYRTDYEYLVNGSEDEEFLTRLTIEQAAEYLQ